MRNGSRIIGGVVLASVAMLACSGGSEGAQGEKGEPGDSIPGTTEPSAGVVFPNVGLLERELDVLLTVDELKITAPPQLDFGGGVEVSEVALLSPSAISAHLTIAADAPVGARDVKITAGQNAVTATGAFKVLSPLDIQVLAGNPEQAGQVAVKIKNRDTSALDPGEFALVGDGIIPVGMVSATATDAVFVLFVEPGAAEGDKQLIGANGNPPLQTFLGDPKSLTVAPRAPIAYAGPLTGETLAQELETKFYKITIPAGTTAIESIALDTAADSKAKPHVDVFPISGKMQDRLRGLDTPSSPFGAPPPPYHLEAKFPVVAGAAAREFLVVVRDAQGQSGQDVKFDFHSSETTATAHAEGATPHPDSNDAETVTIPAAGAGATIITGAIGADGERDAYRFGAAKDDVLEIAFEPGFQGVAIVTKDPALPNPAQGADIEGGVGTSATKPTGDTLLEPLPEARSGTGSNTANYYYVYVKTATGKGTGNYALSLRKVSP